MAQYEASHRFAPLTCSLPLGKSAQGNKNFAYSNSARCGKVLFAPGALHYYMLVKADTREPLLFAAALAALLLYRIANKYLPRYTERRPARPAPRRAQGV